jgi:hypothetical protein
MTAGQGKAVTECPWHSARPACPGSGQMQMQAQYAALAASHPANRGFGFFCSFLPLLFSISSHPAWEYHHD